MPRLPGLEVVRSPIHGYGVVARRDFAAGEVITSVDGVLYREKEILDDTYALWVDEGWYLDMVDQTRWVNHSCDPNTEIEAELDGRGGAWARLVALKDLRAGDELTYDYAFAAEFAEPCRCGAPTCRGWIVDADDLPRLGARLRAAR